MIIRPYGHHGHHQKPSVQLFVVLKLALQNGCVKIRTFTMFGNEIISTTSSATNNPINVFHNTFKTIRKIGKRIDFTNYNRFSTTRLGNYLKTNLKHAVTSDLLTTFHYAFCVMETYCLQLFLKITKKI